MSRRSWERSWKRTIRQDGHGDQGDGSLPPPRNSPPSPPRSRFRPRWPRSGMGWDITLLVSCGLIFLILVGVVIVSDDPEESAAEPTPAAAAAREPEPEPEPAPVRSASSDGRSTSLRLRGTGPYLDAHGPLADGVYYCDVRVVGNTTGNRFISGGYFSVSFEGRDGGYELLAFEFSVEEHHNRERIEFGSGLFDIDGVFDVEVEAQPNARWSVVCERQ